VRVGAPSPNATPLSSPRAQEILAVTKDNYGSVVCRSLMGVRYVPLTTPEKQLAQR
jgi:protein-L-isoaspartate O-methyltransferase